MDALEPTRTMESVESSDVEEEARVLLMPTGKGTFEAMAEASVELVIIILQGFSTVVTGPPRPPPP